MAAHDQDDLRRLDLYYGVNKLPYAKAIFKDTVSVSTNDTITITEDLIEIFSGSCYVKNYFEQTNVLIYSKARELLNIKEEAQYSSYLHQVICDIIKNDCSNVTITDYLKYYYMYPDSFNYETVGNSGTTISFVEAVNNLGAVDPHVEVVSEWQNHKNLLRSQEIDYTNDDLKGNWNSVNIEGWEFDDNIDCTINFFLGCDVVTGVNLQRVNFFWKDMGYSGIPWPHAIYGSEALAFYLYVDNGNLNFYNSINSAATTIQAIAANTLYAIKLIVRDYNDSYVDVYVNGVFKTTISLVYGAASGKNAHIISKINIYNNSTNHFYIDAFSCDREYSWSGEDKRYYLADSYLVEKSPDIKIRRILANSYNVILDGYDDVIVLLKELNKMYGSYFYLDFDYKLFVKSYDFLSSGETITTLVKTTQTTGKKYLITGEKDDWPPWGPQPTDPPTEDFEVVVDLTVHKEDLYIIGKTLVVDAGIKFKGSTETVPADTYYTLDVVYDFIRKKQKLKICNDVWFENKYLSIERVTEVEKNVRKLTTKVNNLNAKLTHLPIGMILPFKGTWVDNETIVGWYVCNAANASAHGTANMTNKFIRSMATSGTTGGSDNAIVVIHDHNIPTDDDLGGTTEVDTTNEARVGDDGSHDHGDADNEGISGVGRNMPAYYSLIFVEKVR